MDKVIRTSRAMKITAPAIFVVVFAIAGFALGRLCAPIYSASPSKEKARELASTTNNQRLRAIAADEEDPLEQVIAGIHRGDRGELLQQLRGIVSSRELPPFLADLYRDALAQRLAKMGAVDELLNPTGFSDKDHKAIVACTVRTLAEADLSNAEKILQSIPDGDLRKHATVAFVEVLGRIDPERGLAWIKENPESPEAEYALFKAWAKVDPRSAGAAASAKLDFKVAHFAVVSEWSEKDPTAAWQWIETLPPEHRHNAHQVFLQALIADDPWRALDVIAATPALSDSYMAQWIGLRIATNAAEADAAVDRLPPGEGRTRLINGIASSLSGDPEAALAWANTLLPGEKEAAVTNLFEALGRTDPAQALDLAAATTDPSARQKSLVSVLSGWAQKDFDEAFGAALEKLDPATLGEALPTILRYSSVPDMDAITPRLAAAGHLNATVRADVFRGLGEVLRMSEEVWERVSHLPAVDQAAFANGAIEAGFYGSPKLTARVVAALPAEKQAEFAGHIGRVLSRSSFRVAADFLSQLPEAGNATQKREALQTVVREWTYLEPGAATGFVAALPAGDTKDAAVRTLAGELRKFDLHGATQLVSTVGTPAARQALIKQLASDWALVDPQRGRASMKPLLQSDEERKQAASLFGQ